MSLNVCTDQLAMALAAPGQLVSVSFLARDPDLSPLHREAERYPVNRGMAEDVFLARPDLVVTGTYTLHNTTQLLKRLGFRVEEFSFVQTLDTIPRDIRRMGALLGREEKAEAMAADFEAGLAEVEADRCEPRPTALAYEQNGVALGKGTLADTVLAAAGFRNLAAEEGVEGMAPFPLELVVEKKPDIVIVPGGDGDAPSLGAFVPRHPALRALPATRIGAFVPRGSWSCGGPAVLEAVKALHALRREIKSCEAPPLPAPLPLEGRGKGWGSARSAPKKNSLTPCGLTPTPNPSPQGAGLSHMDFEFLIGPPPLTPPLKGEGDSEVSAPPSPLRGGVRGGGPGEAEQRLHPYAIALPQGGREPVRAAVAPPCGEAP